MKIKIIREVKSEKQRRWACSMPPELTPEQAKEMCSASIEEGSTMYGFAPKPSDAEVVGGDLEEFEDRERSKFLRVYQTRVTRAVESTLSSVDEDKIIRTMVIDKSTGNRILNAFNLDDDEKSELIELINIYKSDPNLPINQKEDVELISKYFEAMAVEFGLHATKASVEYGKAVEDGYRIDATLENIIRTMLQRYISNPNKYSPSAISDRHRSHDREYNLGMTKDPTLYNLRENKKFYKMLSKKWKKFL